MKKYTKLLLWLSLTLIFIYFCYIVVEAIKDTRAGLAEMLDSDNKLYPHDSALFNSKSLQEISVFEVLRSKARNPISMIVYKEHNIIFFKVDFIDIASKTPFIGVKEKKSLQSTNHSYRVIEQQAFLLMHAKAGKIFLLQRFIFHMMGKTSLQK